MSGALPLPRIKNAFEIGNSRSSEWRSLRFVVARDSTPYLTAALVTQARDGIPHLDSNIRGLQVAWDPDMAPGDLRLWAIYQALLGVVQTGR